MNEELNKLKFYELENEIDAMVYTLYELSEGEIALLEGKNV